MRQHQRGQQRYSFIGIWKKLPVANKYMFVYNGEKRKEHMFTMLVFHVDVNSAFLSWEAAYRLHHLGGRLDLREIPSAVSGDMAARHGIILAKSIPAKRYGIQTGMPVVEARQRCPDLYMVPPNYGLYEKCSRAFLKILREYTPEVEQYSIDEAFLDMTATINLFGNDPVQVAEELKDRIKNELGFTVNVGIASNKLLAKMAGELKKPDLVHTMFPEEIPGKLWPLPVEELFFVGRATTRKLHNLGITTIGELAHTEPALLKSMLKKHGEVIWNFANGRDCSVVEFEPPPQKGYGNSTTISFDVTDASTAKLVLLALAETVGTRLREHQVQAQVLSVGIKSYDFHCVSHQTVLYQPTDITGELHQYASRLFDEIWDGRPIRHLGLHTGRICDETDMRQMNMFEASDFCRLRKLDRTVDRIRKTYGIDAVKRAVFVGSPIDHLSGGVSREKRNVDYRDTIVD